MTCINLFLLCGCNEDPGATNNTLSPELVEVSLPIHNSLEHLDLHVLSDFDRTANPCVLPCCSAAGVSGQTVTARRAALSLNDFNPPYDMGDLCMIANQLSELERYECINRCTCFASNEYPYFFRYSEIRNLYVPDSSFVFPPRNDYISRNWRSKGLRGIRSLRNSMSIENVWTHSENCS